MSTRRQFIQSLPAAGAAFAVAGHLVLEDNPARAQVALVPLKEHFHPKGKAPSKHTLDVLKRARGGLPLADQRDFEEQKRGLIAPMKDLKIMADAGHVAWDMERFQFLDKQDEFDSIHPSLLRQSKLNNNYGLYEVIPGIYQVRGFDLSDISFVRGKTGWIVFDPLVTKRQRPHTGRRAGSHRPGRLFKNNAVGRGTHIPTRPTPPAVVECPAGALPFKMLYCLPKLGESNENSRGR